MEGAPHVSEPEGDIRHLWRDQPREEIRMSIDELRSRSAQLQSRVHRWKSLTVVVFLIAIVGNTWAVVAGDEFLDRVGDLLTLAAIVYLAYQFRGYRPIESMPAGLGLTASRDFYRKQLARQRDFADRPWRYLVPFMPGVGLSLLSGALDRPPAQVVAIAAFGVALFLWAAWWNHRTARQFQREIDELD
jgi:hypothetical protein